MVAVPCLLPTEAVIVTWPGARAVTVAVVALVAATAAMVESLLDQAAVFAPAPVSLSVIVCPTSNVSLPGVIVSPPATT